MSMNIIFDFIYTRKFQVAQKTKLKNGSVHFVVKEKRQFDDEMHEWIEENSSYLMSAETKLEMCCVFFSVLSF